MRQDKVDIWSGYNIADTLSAKENESSLEWYTKEAYTRKVMELLDEHLQPGERVLDIGCGVGKWVVYLVQKGIDCVGVDSSEIAIKKAQQTLREYTPRSVIFKSQATNLPFKRNWFDAIISFGLLEHFPDHETVLNYWKEFLKPGGKMILSVPNGLRWDWMFFDILFKWYKRKALIKMRVSQRGLISTNYGYEERWKPEYFRQLCLHVGFKRFKLTSFFTLSPLIFYCLGNRTISPQLFSLLSSTKASKRWGLYLFGVAE
ncbi:MAG: class I SAM-dependent methyltransferase [candidate division KSB1 bacterium]|nr:class I SAM-dependent methyltransferase [candidate division KSB1 bacterium]